MKTEADFRQEVDIQKISLLDLAAVLLHRKVIVISITVVVAVLSVAYALGALLLPPERSYLPNIYTAKSIIMVGESGGSLSAILGNSSGLAALAGVNVGASKSNGELVVMLAKSNATIDELNQEFNFTQRYKIIRNVRSSTRKAFLGKYAVNIDAKTGTISISFSDIDPEFTQKVVNRAVEILDRRYALLSVNKAGAQKNLLEKKLIDVQAGMKAIEAKIKNFTSRHGVINVEAMATEQVTVLARLRSEIIMKEMDIENYEKISKMDDPVIRRLRQEREGIISKIAEIERGGSLLPSQRNIPALAFEYAGLQRDLTVQMEVFKTLTQQYELAKLETDRQGPSFQVLELAEVPDQKSGPSRSKICIITTMSGFFISILVVYILNAIENIRKDPEAMKILRGEA